MSYFIMLPWLGFDINYVIFTSFTVLALVAHTRCQFTDPGCVPSFVLPPNLPAHVQFDQITVRPYAPPKICRTCRTLKTRRTFHCNTTGRCIVNWDHFCAWCNNSIGALNHRWFFQFILYTLLSCIYCSIILITRFFSCNANPHMCELTSVGTAFAIITFIESLVFGFFTMMMLYDQISAVLEEQFRTEQHYQSQMVAYNAAMQTDAKYFSDPPIRPQERSMYELFQDIFGGPIGLSWFNPFSRPESIVDYFQNELAHCVKEADKITEKFVNFAVAVQEGTIELENQYDDDIIEEEILEGDNNVQDELNVNDFEQDNSSNNNESNKNDQKLPQQEQKQPQSQQQAVKSKSKKTD